MKPSVIDRFFVSALACVLSASCACLVLAWMHVFETSGEASSISIASLLLSTAFASVVGPRLVRLFSMRFSRRSPGADLLAKTGFPLAVDPRMDNRVLAVSSMFCGLCVLVTPTIISQVGTLVDFVAPGMLWPSWLWIAFSLTIQSVAMLPSAIALLVAFVASSAIRGGGGTDPFASGTRNWTAGLGAGLLTVSAIWRLGLDLASAASALGAGLIVMGVWILTRRRLTTRPPRPPTEIPGQSHPPRLGSVCVLFLVAAIVAGLQCRIMADALGADLGWQIAWMGISLVVFAWAMSREDHRPPVPSAAPHVLGLLAACALQMAIAISPLWLGSGFAIPLVTLSALAQLPMCHLAAGIVSRQRRVFAAGGQKAGAYLSRAAFGWAVGILALLAAGHLWPARLAVVLAFVLIAAVATWNAINRSTKWHVQVAWAAMSAALLLSSSMSGALAIASATKATGPFAIGASLSVASPHSSDARIMGAPALGEDPEISLVVRRALASGASWWIVDATNRGVELDPTGQRVLEHWNMHARTAMPAYDGALLAPIRADHPRAWRFFNITTIGDCYSLTRPPGSVMMIRTQASRDNIAPALSCARTLREVTGSGYMVFRVDDSKIDLLAIGPMDAQPPIETTARVLGLDVLDDLPQAVVVSLRAPYRMQMNKLSADEFDNWLARPTPTR